MDIDERITIAKELIAKREEIDAKLAELFGGATLPAKVERACKRCGQTGHNARNCASFNAPSNGESANV